jgi:hypothetical protein
MLKAKYCSGPDYKREREKVPIRGWRALGEYCLRVAVKRMYNRSEKFA